MGQGNSNDKRASRRSSSVSSIFSFVGEEEVSDEHSDVLQADFSHPALQIVRKKPTKHLKAAGQGLMSAAMGVMAAITNPELMGAELRLLKAVGKRLAMVYGALVVVAILLWPITAALAFASPASIFTLFQMAPLWALNVIQSNSNERELMRDVFFSELMSLDKSLAKRVSQAAPGNQKIGLWNRIKTSVAFTSYSLFANVLGFLPGGILVVSAIQSIVVAERFGVKMLDPYISTLKGYNAKKKFLRANYFILLGFSLCWVWVSTIPVLNAFALVYAQAGAAHLLTKCILLEGE